MTKDTNSSRVKLMQLNAENLFLFLDEELPLNWQELSEANWQALSRASVPTKSLKKTKALAQCILEEGPHLIALNEVGGLESLENFNRLFLRDSYQVFLEEGNSDRGIDVGYLVRRDWKKTFKLISHKERPINFLYPHEIGGEANKKSHLFSRDCSELQVFSSTDSSEPDLIFFLVHLKSKLDTDGIDPFGNLRRGAEVATLVSIYEDSKVKYPKASRVVLGDFNGVARGDKREPEFDVIYERTDLKNALELAQVEEEFCTTQVQFARTGKRSLFQFDYIFLSEDLHAKLDPNETYVYRYKNDLGIHSSLPTNFDEKVAQPSDHYPVVVTLNL